MCDDIVNIRKKNDCAAISKKKNSDHKSMKFRRSKMCYQQTSQTNLFSYEISKSHLKLC